MIIAMAVHSTARTITAAIASGAGAKVQGRSMIRAVGNSTEAAQLIAPAAVTTGGSALKRRPHIGANA